MQLNNRHYAVAAEAVRSTTGGVQVFILTVGLGPVVFGHYSQAFAVAGVVGPLAMAGATFWLQPYLENRDNQRAATSHIVLWTAIAAFIASPVIAGICSLISPAPYWGLFLVIAAEMGLFPGWYHLTLMRLALNAGLSYFVWTTLMSLSRLAAAIFLLLFDTPDLVLVGVTLSAIGIIGTIACLISSRWRPGEWFAALHNNSRRAVSFTAIALIESALDGMDKVLLAGAISQRDFGVLAAASRIDNYALVPARGIAREVYPKFFRSAGNRRYAEFRRILWECSRIGVLSTLVVGLGIIFGVWILQDSLFGKYEGLAITVALLMPRMIIRPITYAFGDALYALGKASSRLISLSVTGAVYCLLLVTVVPPFGIFGAAMAGFLVEVANLALFGHAYRRHMRSQCAPAKHQST